MLKRQIALRGRRVRVCGPSAIIGGLAAFYRPYYAFEEADEGEADWTLDLAVVANSGRRAIELDPAVYLSRPARVDGPLETFERPGQDMIIALDRTCRRIGITGADPAEVELQARILLRDQILQTIEKRAGDVIVHAAAVQKEGKGLAFLGSKNAGKTTALLRMMFGRGFDFVSSDRIKLTRGLGEGLHLVGVPARVNVHQAALAEGELLEAFGRNPTLAPVRQGKILIDAKQLAAAAGVSLAGSARVRGLIFPQVQPGADLTVVRLEPTEILARLQANLMDGGNGDSHGDWLDLHREVGVAHAIDRLTAVTADTGLFGLSVVGDYPSYVHWLAHGGLEARLGHD